MSTTCARPRLVLGAATLLGCFLLFAHAPAQLKLAVPATPPNPPKDGKADPKKDGKQRNNFTDAFSLEIDRDASNKIEAVRQYLQKKDVPWNTIIEVLQKLLESQKDTFVEIERDDPKKGKTKTRVSVKTEVNRIIGSFPPAGREFYQLAYGQVADQRLKKALEENDKAALAEVVERYLHTKAGAEAAVRLGTWHLDRGRYIMAAFTFQKLQYRSADEPLPPAVLFQAALAFKRLGEPEIAQGYWKRMQEGLAGKNELVLAPNKKITLDQLRDEYDKVVAGAFLRDQADWFMGPGGALNRNARGIGGRPFLEPRFSFSLLAPYLDEEDRKANKGGFDWIEQNLKMALSQFDQRPHVPLPAFFPVASGGKVIFRTYDGVYCLATKDDASQNPPVKGGELLWRVECDYSLHAMVKENGPRNTMDAWYKTNSYQQHGPFGIFFENGLIGSLSHDGVNVYFVDDLAVPPHPHQMAQFAQQGQQAIFGPFQDGVHHNRLVAVNMETGKLIWKAGGRSSGTRGDEKKEETAATLLADCHFLGAPLPLAGKLYVVAEKERELLLVCLDPDKDKVDQATKHPQLLWFQPLGSPNHPMPQDTVRRIQGINLAYSDGILVCPTNAGALLGIDLLSHTLVWAHSYREAGATPAVDPNQPKLPGVGFRRGAVPIGIPGAPGGPAALNQDRWRASAPMIAGGKVVFTAYDSSSVQCLDLRTGELLWKSPRATEDLYVAGVFDDRVMVVGKNAVRFLNLEAKDPNGERVGRDIPIGTPSGVGTASGTTYYLPVKASPDTKEPEVWSIDVLKGEVIAKTKSRKKHPAGNLVFFEGDVYSQTPHALMAFPQLQVKIENMNRELAKDPNNPVGLVEMGELQLDDGKRLESIATLKKALGFKPNEATRAKAREKLYEGITELLQHDFAAGEKFLDEYKDLCNVPPPPDADALKRQQAAEEELNRKSKAYFLIAEGRERQGKLLDAFENYMAFGRLNDARELVAVPNETNTTARPDVLARARIDHMIRKAAPEVRKPLEDKIAQEWAKVKDADDLQALRNFVRVFGGMFSFGSEARLLLADKLLATNNEDEMREAQNILLSLRNAGEDRVAARAVEGLARLFIRKGLLEDAVALYAELDQRFGQVEVRDGKTGAEFYNDLITDKRFLPYLEPMRQSWAPRVKAQEITGNSPIQPQPTFTIEPDGEQLPFFRRHRLVMETNFQNTGMWGLRVVDRLTGEERFRSQPLPMPQYFYNFPQSNFRIAQVRGHLLVLHINNLVYAFDLADRKQLWQYNLFGKTPMTNANPVQQIPEPDGTLRLVYQDGWTQKVGQAGVVESTYVCLVTRDGLVALDPARGTTLWTKSNVSPRVHLVGDEENIYVFEQNQDGSPAATRVLRAQDGVAVEGVPDSSALFAKSNRLRIFGRNVLVFEDQNNKKAFRMVDLLTGKDVWRKGLDAGAIALRSNDSTHIGYVTPGGEIFAFDVRTGKEVFRNRIDEKWVKDHLAKVTEALLLEDGERFYVALNRPPENGISVNPVVNQGMRTVRVNGHMYCFDKASGKRLWFTDEQLENQTVILEQFHDLPVLLAATQFTKVNNGVFERNGVSVMAIEKATGRARYRKEVGPNGQFHALVTDPKVGSIELWRHDLRIRFTPDDGKTTGAADGPNPPLAQRGSPPPAVRVIAPGPVRIQILKRR